MTSPTKKHVKKDVLFAAIRNSRGIVNIVARNLGVDWHTAKRMISEDPAAFQLMENERETLIDTAESSLIKLMGAEDDRVKLSASTFVLERLGKHRGYSQKQEIDHTTGGDKVTGLTVSFVGKK